MKDVFRCYGCVHSGFGRPMSPTPDPCFSCYTTADGRLSGYQTTKISVTSLPEGGLECPGPCPKCGSPDVQLTSFGGNGYTEIRCRDCGWHICDYSWLSDADECRKGLVKRWNSEHREKESAMPKEAVTKALEHLEFIGRVKDGRVHFGDIVHLNTAKALLKEALGMPFGDEGTARESEVKE